MSVKGTLIEDKMRRFKGECAQFSFNKCLIYIHDGASFKFSTNSHEKDNSACVHYTVYSYSHREVGLKGGGGGDRANQREG